MKKERRVILTGEAEAKARKHLLQYMQEWQEDICFALWNPSTGKETIGAIIDEIVLPEENERHLHGGASVEPAYTARAISEACKKNKGIAMMHSHPVCGWQDLSPTDARTEGENIAWSAGSTGLPLIGMTIGKDGYWSARFWEKNRREETREPAWCRVVQTSGKKNGKLHFHPDLAPIPQRRDELRRTYDTWGTEAQNRLARSKVGIVGLGSVGCIIAECMARMGIQDITLIDHDTIEIHNLDRILYGNKRNIGKSKAKEAKKRIRKASTAKAIKIQAVNLPIQEETALNAAIDCNIIFSCVDRPVPRDVLNRIAVEHCIPLIECGIAVTPSEKNGELTAAKWIVQIVVPERQCLMCSQQYTGALLGIEMDGSLGNSSYVSSLLKGNLLRNENVFPFSLAAAAMQANLMIRYLAAPNWWPESAKQEYQLSTTSTDKENKDCHPSCRINKNAGKGDKANTQKQ